MSRYRFTYTLERNGIELTDTQERELDMALSDISKMTPQIHVRDFTIELHEYLPIGKCGNYDHIDQKVFVAPPECGKRGYSDYRWRVNRTLHGVILHEVGHHFEYAIGNLGDMSYKKLQTTFPAESDITNYSDKSYRENFAEAFRVYASNAELLKAIDKDKYNFLWSYVRTPNDDRLEEFLSTLNGTVVNQLENASTNKHIREYLKEKGIW